MTNSTFLPFSIVFCWCYRLCQWNSGSKSIFMSFLHSLSHSGDIKARILFSWNPNKCTIFRYSLISCCLERMIDFDFWNPAHSINSAKPRFPFVEYYYWKRGKFYFYLIFCFMFPLILKSFSSVILMCYLMQWITEVNWRARNRMKTSLLADLDRFTDVNTISLIYFLLQFNIE